jgi:hypothetical protein
VRTILKNAAWAMVRKAAIMVYNRHATSIGDRSRGGCLTAVQIGTCIV